ncbi:lysophospholipase [Myriangium duriaei CBS 260.36]|uniref:Lysophospholipase n=1 Tax=Myriangium duriaei CBS 260.36 TaxID=1168546 RepID=A0A9P4J8M2_9PEZI|nr:lysophospholipase [Myriangium duriaei CBS 260.36]
MKSPSAALAAVCALTGAVSAAPAPAPAPVAQLDERTLIPSGYAPYTVSCPSGSLNRAATSLNPSEAAYITSRKAKANPALASWLKRQNSGFDTSTLPTVGFAASGGSYRALLNAAGVVQALDSRDSNVGTSGVFQGLSYFGGLSGGAWLLSSLAGNNWPTVSNLRDTLWADAFSESLFLPGDDILSDAFIINDIIAKTEAGFPPTIVDPWGRLLSYQLLKGFNGGVKQRLSGLTSLGNFTAANAPFPIMTTLGVATFQNECSPHLNSTQYEFTPYEFGSWESGVAAFTQAAYLGTSMSNGSPTGKCINNFDNLGFVLGTSSDYFGQICGKVFPDNSSLPGVLEQIVDKVKTPATIDTYATYPNPFYQSSGSPFIQGQAQLHLADGGIGGQNDPIWPFIQNQRPVQVLIVSDNSGDSNQTLPDGSELYNTYRRAQQVGLTKMPTIPPNTTFIAEGLNTRATIFGCNEPNALTIVWLPNVEYSYASNTSTLQLEYTESQTNGIIANGNNIATQNGDAQWPTCLACAMQKKTGTTLPSACDACFEKYCWTA